MKQMFHNTPFLPHFHWKKCFLWLCLVWWIFRKNKFQKLKILTLAHVFAHNSKSASFSHAETQISTNIQFVQILGLFCQANFICKYVVQEVVSTQTLCTLKRLLYWYCKMWDAVVDCKINTYALNGWMAWPVPLADDCHHHDYHHQW